MNDTYPGQAGKVHKHLATIIMGLALASCSDGTSDEALFFLRIGIPASVRSLLLQSMTRRYKRISLTVRL